MNVLMEGLAARAEEEGLLDVAYAVDCLVAHHINERIVANDRR